jgi:hypothetical protein
LFPNASKECFFWTQIKIKLHFRNRHEERKKRKSKFDIKLSKKGQKLCQKVVEKLSKVVKKLSKSCQKDENSQRMVPSYDDECSASVD